MNALLQRLRERKLVQWPLAYLAAAWLLVQVCDVLGAQFGWSAGVLRGVTLAFGTGFFLVLIAAWYHGEKGRQKVGAMELSLIALVLAIGGVLLWRFAPSAPGMETSQAAANAGESPNGADAAIPAKSVAVLPLANQSGDTDQQYFSDGLTDNLIVALSQFDGLKVIGRNSSFRFRDSSRTSAEIGRLLGVAHLLEGSVQRAGDTVRIRAQLVDAADGRTLWSQRYDRAYTDLFALQDDITRAVAGALRTKLLSSDGGASQSDHPPGGDLDAYDAFLQAQFHGRRLTETDTHRAIDFYRQAIALDPDYAAAWAGLALARMALFNYFLNEPEPRRQAIADARAAVDKALALGPDLAVAHRANAELMMFDFDWQGWRRELQRALQLAPGDPQALLALGHSHAALGEVQAGVDLIRQAIDVDPYCAACHYRLALLLPSLGRFDEARHAGDRAIELDPDNKFAADLPAAIEIWRGDIDAALPLARAVKTDAAHLVLAMALAHGDDRADADAELQKSIETFGVRGAFQIAMIHAQRREPDEMFEWLERAYEHHDLGLGLLLSEPGIGRYKHDPRFAALCRKIGLPVPGGAAAMERKP